MHYWVWTYNLIDVLSNQVLYYRLSTTYKSKLRLFISWIFSFMDNYITSWIIYYTTNKFNKEHNAFTNKTEISKVSPLSPSLSTSTHRIPIPKWTLILVWISLLSCNWITLYRRKCTQGVEHWVPDVKCDKWIRYFIKTVRMWYMYGNLLLKCISI